jgi:hypothetical protein
VSTLVFDLQTNGSFGTASAIGLYMVAVLTGLVLVARRLAGAGIPGGAAEDKRSRRLLGSWSFGKIGRRLATPAPQGGRNA